MAITDTTRRLPPRVIAKDIDSFNNLDTIEGYVAPRSEVSSESLQQAYNAMLVMQKKETEMESMRKAAIDAARQAEWEFHTTVIAMKESVRAQFGPDSNEAQAIGYKKKSERKRPRRRSA
jgi:hypothetical protein